MNKKHPVLDNYDKVRQEFLTRTIVGETPSRPITDPHGFYLQNPNFLFERYAGVDKLFHTLVKNVVEDPDFALKKDPKVYERMLRDPQIYYCLGVRKSAVSSLEWHIAPPEGMEQDEMARRIANECNKRLKRAPRFEELIDNIMDALLPGVSVNEIVWTYDKDKDLYIVKDHFPVNKDRILFDKDGRLKLKQPGKWQGEYVPPYKFIVHVVNLADGSWQKPHTIGYSYYGRGLADTPLYHYFYFKMMALRYYMKAMERNASPVKIFYSGAQNTLMAKKMASILTALQNDSVVGIPGKKGDMAVDILRLVGQPALFTSFIEYIDKLITRTILFQELMTEMPAVGSYAAARVHASVFARISALDRKKVEETLTRTLVRWDIQLNYPQLKEDYYPRFRFKESATLDTAAFLQTVQMALDLGLDVSEAQVRAATGLRAPGPGEKSMLDLVKDARKKLEEEEGIRPEVHQRVPEGAETA